MADREIHLWTMRLAATGASIRTLYDMCSQDEKRRAEAYRFSNHRNLFIIGRGLLRVTLSRYLRERPEHILFRYGPKGKPALAGRRVPPLHFNLAHCEERVLFAITQNNEVGVDLERVRELPDVESIAENFFSSQECKDLRSVDPSLRAEAFFNCWTRKEAYLKALGDGLSAPLDRCQVTLKPGELAAFLKFDEGIQDVSRWSLRHLTPAAGYVGALAIRMLGCSFVERDFQNAEECLSAFDGG